jgi:hypothetical protein
MYMHWRIIFFYTLAVSIDAFFDDAFPIDAFLYDFCMIFICILHDFCMIFAWFLHDFCMIFAWFLHDFCMHFAWFIYDFLHAFCLHFALFSCEPAQVQERAQLAQGPDPCVRCDPDCAVRQQGWRQGPQGQAQDDHVPPQEAAPVRGTLGSFWDFGGHLGAILRL